MRSGKWNGRSVLIGGREPLKIDAAQVFVAGQQDGAPQERGFSQHQTIVNLRLRLIAATAAVAVLILWKGRTRRAIAFPLAFVFVLFAAIMIPNIFPPRIAQAQPACVSYLAVIQKAKAEWAQQNQKLLIAIPRLDELFSTNSASPHHWIPKCPGGGDYSVGAANQKPSYTLSNEGHVLP